MAYRMSALVDVVGDIIKDAERDGISLDEGNVVDLIADHLPEVSLSDIRAALSVAGYWKRFPKACTNRVVDVGGHIVPQLTTTYAKGQQLKKDGWKEVKQFGYKGITYMILQK